METLVCLEDFEQKAKKRVSSKYWTYISTGADGETTLRENQEAFRRLKLKPRVLTHYRSDVDLSTTVLGRQISLPVGTSPVASQVWVCPDGDICTATAAEEINIPFTSGISAGCSLEEIASSCPRGLKWLQFYKITDDDAFTEDLLKRAEQAGYSALVWTVDGVRLGMKRELARKGFDLSSEIRSRTPNWSLTKTEGLTPERHFDSILNWDTYHWLCSLTKLPVIIKGILTVEDALLAVKHGAPAIVVSNHGGRQLDEVPAAIEVLPEISRAVAGRLEIYMDGGVRTGTDVLKALALGARAVFLGRPVMWGLACGGKDGVKKLLNILKEELSVAMQLSGCRSIANITPDLVMRKYYYANL